MDFTNFQAPRYSYKFIRSKADELRNKLWKDNSLPICTEKILESYYDIRINPANNLKKKCDVDSFITADFKEIYVDADFYMDDRFVRRVNYSLAHELGHMILHKDVYNGFGIESIEMYHKFIEMIPDDEYDWIERHAYEFAGRFLVPIDELTQDFQIVKPLYQKFTDQFPDYDKNDVAEYVARAVKTDYGVSEQVIGRRLLREKLIFCD